MTFKSFLRTLVFVVLTTGIQAPVLAQNTESGVTYEDILNGLSEPSKWLTYSGDYTGQRHSPLTMITPGNVQDLVPIWTFQTGTMTRGRGFETTPLVLDGVLYVTGSNNFAWALDARTGRPFWQYRRNLPAVSYTHLTLPANREV